MKYVLLLVFFFGLQAGQAGAEGPSRAQQLIPDHFRGQPFGVQWHWLDTCIHRLEGSAENYAVLELQLNQEAAHRNDPIFIQVIDLNRFRRELQGDSLRMDVVRQVETWVEEQTGGDKNAVKATTFQLLADHYWNHKQYSAGLEYYIRAYSIYKNLEAESFPAKSSFLYQYASQYYHFHDFRTVKDLLLEMWNTIPEEYVDNQVTSLNTLGLCYGQLAQYDSSEYYFQKAIEFVDRNDEQVWRGIVKGNLSMNLIQQGKYEEAIPLLEANIESSRKRKAMVDLAFALVGMGEIRLMQGRPGEALALIQEGYDILESKNKFNQHMFQARVFVPLGKALMANGRAQEAFAFLDAGRMARDSVEAQRNALFLSGVQHKLETEQHLAALALQDQKLKEQRLLMIILGCILFGSALFTVIFFRQKRKISAEKKRSDHLLLNILPEDIASDLKRHGKVKARHYKMVTILFTDFKDFTRIAESMSAEDLVRDLDHYFRRFDEITSRYGLEKIKTIGDAYMAASGLPAESDDHAHAAVSAGLALREMVKEEELIRKKESRPWFELRIGLHSGPVVAGVIGLRKFSYDIWGDTVNIAARMESSGEVGQVNISAATFDLVRDQFLCTYRGKIPAKNKGEIGMYFVEKENE